MGNNGDSSFPKSEHTDSWYGKPLYKNETPGWKRRRIYSWFWERCMRRCTRLIIESNIGTWNMWSHISRSVKEMSNIISTVKNTGLSEKNYRNILIIKWLLLRIIHLWYTDTNRMDFKFTREWDKNGTSARNSCSMGIAIRRLLQAKERYRHCLYPSRRKCRKISFLRHIKKPHKVSKMFQHPPRPGKSWAKPIRI